MKNTKLLLSIIAGIALIGILYVVYRNTSADAYISTTAPVNTIKFKDAGKDLESELSKFNTYMEDYLNYEIAKNINSSVTASSVINNSTSFASIAHAQTSEEVNTLLQEFVNSKSKSLVSLSTNLLTQWYSPCYRGAKAYAQFTADVVYKKTVKTGTLKIIGIGGSKTTYLAKTNGSAIGTHYRAGYLKNTDGKKTWYSKIDKNTPRYWDPSIPTENRIAAETINTKLPETEGIFNYIEFEVVKDASGKYIIKTINSYQGDVNLPSSKGYSQVAFSGIKSSDDLIDTQASYFGSFDEPKCKEIYDFVSDTSLN